VAPCLHGFEPGHCLICQTLGPSTSSSSTGSRPTRSERRAGRDGHSSGVASGGPVEVVDARPRTVAPRSGRHIAIAVLMVIAAVVAFWIVAGVVFALLRLLEIVIVAAVAGVLGYRLGRARGHRDRDR
jgi:Flp pilus assembly protein TadB